MNSQDPNPPLPPYPLHADDLNDLERSGLSVAMIEAMGCTSASAETISRATGVSVRSAGYSIPYHGIKDQTGAPYRRWRLAGLSSGMKYVSGKGEDPQLYLPPGLKALSSHDFLVITEGEKKAARAVQDGIHCVGLQGVSCWTDSAWRAVEKEAGLKVSADSEPLPALLEIAKQYRCVLILGDSDLLGNPVAKSALDKLKKALQKRGCHVALAFCPPAENAAGIDRAASAIGKQGLDDWLKRQPPAVVTKALTAMFHGRAMASEAGSEAFTGRHFGIAHSNALVYSPSRGWMEYVGPHWTSDIAKRRFKLLTEYAHQLAEWADDLGELAAEVGRPWSDLDTDRKPQEVQGWLSDICSAAQTLRSVRSKLGKLRGVEDVLSFAQAFSAADDALWDKDPHLLGVVNGVVDLRSGELLQGDPALKITRCAGTRYDPLATCATWDAFLQRVQPSAEERLNLQHAAGYCATGETREQVFFISFGQGANGKSTFESAVGHALGSYADASQPVLVVAKGDLREQQQALSRLVGTRFVTIAETEQHMELATAALKRISGEDLITARPLYKKSFSFRPVCKVLIPTNHLPHITDTSYGMARRLRILHWPVVITQETQDSALRYRLGREVEGILAWIVNGAVLYYRSGLPESGRCRLMKETLLGKADTLRSFLEAATIADQSGTVQSSVLHMAYCDWMTSLGQPGMGSQRFSRDLQTRGYKKSTDSRHNVIWKGLRLTDEPSTRSRNTSADLPDLVAPQSAMVPFSVQTPGGNILI